MSETMTGNDIWSTILGDVAQGICARQAMFCIAQLDKETLSDAISSIERETSIGPMMNPSAYLDGSRFDNAREYKAILRKLIELRELIP